MDKFDYREVMLSPARRAYLSAKAKEQRAEKVAARAKAKQQLAQLAKPVTKRQPPIKQKQQKPKAHAASTASLTPQADSRQNYNPPVQPRDQVETPPPSNGDDTVAAASNNNYGIPNWVWTALGDAARAAIARSAGGANSSAGDTVQTNFQPYGSTTGGEFAPRRRRRRRRLLTCSDKSDIAFLHGQLGGGQLGKAAISALLSRRC